MIIMDTRTNKYCHAICCTEAADVVVFSSVAGVHTSTFKEFGALNDMPPVNALSTVDDVVIGSLLTLPHR